MTLVDAGDDHFAWLLGERSAPAGLSAPPEGVESPAVLAWLRATAADLRAAHGPGAWLIVAGDDVVGLCSYKAAPDATEIGYGVAASHRKQGYATRAVGDLAALAARDARLGALIAETHEANVASQRVLQHNGFAITGRRVDPQDGPLLVWTLDLARAPSPCSAHPKNSPSSPGVSPGEP